MDPRISGQEPWRRVRRTVKSAVPAAGAEATIQVPGDKLWRVESVLATLVTSATVANRTARLVISDSDGTFRAIPAATDQAASATSIYQWLPLATPYVKGTYQLAQFVPLTLQPGDTLATLTASIDATDAWSALTLRVVETTFRQGMVDLSTMLADMLEGGGWAES
jgi:hypothetical protein